MARTIITSADIGLDSASSPQSADTGGVEPDDYKSKLMKYIPGEVVALYVTLEAMVKSSVVAGDSTSAYWVIFLIGLAGTPFYLWGGAKIWKVKQIVISTMSFAVWVFALGGPFESLEWYQAHKVYAAMVLPVYTFMVATLDP